MVEGHGAVFKAERIGEIETHVQGTIGVFHACAHVGGKGGGIHWLELLSEANLIFLPSES